MGGKKKGKTKSGKRVARRVGASEEIRPQKQKAAAPVQEEEKPKIPERIQEKDSGFGVIKVVVGVIVVLILAAGVLSRMIGGEETVRGDKVQGELCESTQECTKGSICFSYGDDKRRCLATCSKEKTCEEGLTCVSSAERSGRKSTRVRAVCVEDSKAKPSDR